MNVLTHKVVFTMNGGRRMNPNLHFTIFGGTGDLTFRKLLPALYNMYVSDKFNQDFRVVIIGRRDFTNASYCEKAKSWVQEFARLPYRENDFDDFAKGIQYVQMDFTKETSYDELNNFYKEHGIRDHIFYFAVAPRFFSVIAHGLSHVEGARDGKVIIEKPFGEDLISAHILNEDLEAFFTRERIYHIDHYLGKEMVRNIQAIRFMNPVFTDVWNHTYIENVQISALENVGVETRGGYYDQSGALKDMIQNHLFQILSIVGMEQPLEFFGEDMHDKQLAVLRSLRPAEQLDMADTMVLGQYFGYQKEPAVERGSQTETYAALRLFIDNERWKGVPFYIRTGKKLNRREMEVAITFKRSNPNVEANVLLIKIQPTEGVYFQFNIKKPGDSDEIMPTSMDFCQSCYDINRINTPEAYERLLMAAVNHDSSWFSKWDQIELSWQYIDQLKARFKEEQLPLATYATQSFGPQEASDLLQRHEHAWIDIDV